MEESRTIITTAREFDLWLKRSARENPQMVYGFDTETTSLKYSELECIGFSLFDGRNACYVDLLKASFSESSKIRTLFAKFLPSIRLLVMHNAPFDLKVLHKDFDVKRNFAIFCTLTAAHLLNENQKRKDLKHLAKKILKVPDDEILLWDKASEAGYHSETFYRYAMNDAIYTYKLYQIQAPLLEIQGLEHLFYDIEMPFQFVLRDMEIHGMGFDQAKCQQMLTSVGKIITDCKLKMAEILGLKPTCGVNLFGEDVYEFPVNFNSNQQLIELIESKLGIEIDEYTDNGNKSLGKATISKFLNKHEFFQVLDKFRRARKLYESFLVPLPGFVDTDGRIRPNFHNTVTVTGRLSCSEPNLEQLPRENDICNIRELFIASPGHKLVVADYSGQELRVLAEVTQDERLLRAFREDMDLHLMTANAIFNLGIPDEKLKASHPEYPELKAKFKKERHIGKNGVNFPIIYGSTAKGVSYNIGVSEAKAQEYIDKFFALYPGVKAKINKTKRFLNIHGYVVNLSGRRRRFYGITEKAYRQAFNFLIQGFSADMVKAAAARIRLDENIKIVNLVHDEIVCEVPEHYVAAAQRYITDCMKTAVKMSIPLEVEIGIGDNYGEAK